MSQTPTSMRIMEAEAQPNMEISRSTNANQKKNAMVRLSKWFVRHQKSDGWNYKAINALHVGIIGLLAVAYICHIISGPLFQSFINKQETTVIRVIEALFLSLAFVCFLKMCYVNGSLAAAKMLRVGSARIYVYGFWLLRSIVVEILKGQPIYAFLISFHSILIYATDTWYLCNQKVLIANVAIYLLMITYEFFLSISPFAVGSEVWVLLNVKTTANSLSRSHYFNFFMIFFDAFIMILYDSERSKYVMIVKKQKRAVIALSESKQKVLHFAWMIMAFLIICIIASYPFFTFTKEKSSAQNYLFDIIPAILGVCTFCNAAVVFLYSTNTESRKHVLSKLLQERRVIFILMLLGVLFYVDVVYMNTYDDTGGSIFGILFPLAIIMYIMSDFICASFPRNGMLVVLTGMLLLLLFQIVRHMFLVKNCEVHMFAWGILGEKISYCTVRRLTYQTIFSLMTPAALQTILRRSHNMNFCNANVYRSSGTVDRHLRNHDYISSMKSERYKSRQKKFQQVRKVETV